MQQQQPGRRFAEPAPQQIVHRFPQNQQQPANGWQPQGNYPAQPRDPYQAAQPDAYGYRIPETEQLPPLSKREARKQARKEKKARKRRRFSLIWTLLALIGLATVIIQGARYIVIPLLVYLNVITGGTV